MRAPPPGSPTSPCWWRCWSRSPAASGWSPPGRCRGAGGGRPWGRRRGGGAAGPVEVDDRPSRPASPPPEPLGVAAARRARGHRAAHRPRLRHRPAAVGGRLPRHMAPRRGRPRAGAAGGLARARASGSRHRTDLSRRTLLRAGTLGASAAAVYVAITAVVRAAGLPGASRRFTGSYEAGSFDPAAMPTTSWIDDVRPRSTRPPGACRRRRRRRARARSKSSPAATRACARPSTAPAAGTPTRTGRAYRSGLVRNTDAAQSLHVHSTTGYWIQFPIGDLDRLLLATRAGGAPLSVGHGFPARLVAPGRRGFWWVMGRPHEPRSTPWWWQPPFPVT